MQVFIQNEAGAAIKNRHDEKTLEWKSRETVSRPYPYPYGFVLRTTAEDAGNVDCFVLTSRPLVTGQIVECNPIALMEQVEDGEVDHNILAAIPDEPLEVTNRIRQALTDFVLHVFDHIPGKRIQVGEFLDAQVASEYIDNHRD